jgi:AraC-like DNA-binding protein
MQYRILKENRRHGDILLPISDYKIVLSGLRDILECHWHDEMELFKVTGGSFRFQIASQYFEVAQGDVLFINSGELHSAMAEQNGDYSFEAIVFSPDMLKGPSEDKVQMEYLSPLLNGRLAVQRIFHPDTQPGKRVQELFDNTYQLLVRRPPAYEISLKANLYLILNELVQTGNGITELKELKREAASSESIKKVIRYLHENYASDITIDMLAGYSSMSSGHLCRVFKKYTMKTPIEYLNCCRVSNAVMMLESTNRKILDIALDCGFSSLSYFIHVFRENMGCSPSEYRRKELHNNEVKNGSDPSVCEPEQ